MQILPIKRFSDSRVYSMLRLWGPRVRYESAVRLVQQTRAHSIRVKAALDPKLDNVSNDPLHFFPLLPPVSGFGEDFKNSDYMLKDGADILSKNHGHALDSHMIFDEDAHVYYYDGQRINYSVTQTISQYMEEFDSFHAIDLMKKSKNWPRPEYTNRSGDIWTDEQIKQFWDKMSMYSRNRGTWMHYNIERFYNNLNIYQDTPEIQQFLNFHEEFIKMKIQPYRTEWRICAPNLSLAGSVDFVGRLDDGTYAIIDWKRSKQKMKNNFFSKKMKAPLAHLDETSTMQYYLQLNLYRRILQVYYDIPVSRMILAYFHPENKDNKYVVDEVPILDYEASAIMDALKNDSFKKN